MNGCGIKSPQTNWEGERRIDRKRGGGMNDKDRDRNV